MPISIIVHAAGKGVSTTEAGSRREAKIRSVEGCSNAPRPAPCSTRNLAARRGPLAIVYCYSATAARGISRKFKALASQKC